MIDIFLNIVIVCFLYISITYFLSNYILCKYFEQTIYKKVYNTKTKKYGIKINTFFIIFPFIRYHYYSHMMSDDIEDIKQYIETQKKRDKHTKEQNKNKKFWEKI